MQYRVPDLILQHKIFHSVKVIIRTVDKIGIIWIKISWIWKLWFGYKRECLYFWKIHTELLRGKRMNYSQLVQKKSVYIRVSIYKCVCVYTYPCISMCLYKKYIYMLYITHSHTHTHTYIWRERRKENNVYVAK